MSKPTNIDRSMDNDWINKMSQQQMQAQQVIKPIDWDKILKPKPKQPPIQPLDLSKYDGMRLNGDVANLIIWDTQAKINEIIRRINQ